MGLEDQSMGKPLDMVNSGGGCFVIHQLVHSGF